MTRPRPRGRPRAAWSALAAASIALVGLAPATASPTHHATTICVGHGPGCTTLKDAVKHARDGDTITIAPGTYPGGITIDHDVTVVGAGAKRTTIKGGGPVVTIGNPLEKKPPKVEIRGVTITGGFTRSFPDEYGLADPDAVAAGGGVLVNFGKNGGKGGTLRLVDTIVRGNRVSPTSSILFTVEQGADCPEPGCQYAASYGAGIETAGDLTLVRTTVTGNRGGSAAADDDVSSDATGAGIDTGVNGTVTLVDSAVTRNRASVEEPNGRFVEGVGVFLNGPSLTIRNSRVSGNRGVLHTHFSDATETVADGGGVRVGAEGHLTLVGSQISRNRIETVNSAGTSQAWSGGLQLNGTIDARSSRITDNRAVSGSASNPFPAYADGGGGEIDGDFGDDQVLNRVVVSGNRLVASSQGDDVTLGGAGLFNAPFDPGSVIVTRSRIVGNTLSASAPTGTISAYGAGLWNIGGLVLDRSKVAGNTTALGGNGGAALGGGVFNGAYAPEPDLPITPLLTAIDSEITGNTLGFSAAMSGSGSGVYTETLPSLTGTTIADNFPEPQCAGCTPGRRVSPHRYRGPHGAWAHDGERSLPPELRWLR